MPIDLDHALVPAHNRDASAKLLAETLGVPCGPASVGPFYEVYVNGGTTLDFIQTDEPFPVYHFCFRVGPEEFAAIQARLKEKGIPFRSKANGEADNKVDPTYGNCYWNEPEGHVWEMLQVSYTRKK